MRPILGCALLVAALASAACKTMKPVTMDQLNAIKPDRAWVTESDQSVVLMSGPQVVGDTLVGYVGGQYQELPSAGLKQVVIQRPAPARTALLALGVAAGLGGFVVAIAGGGQAALPNASAGDCDKHPDQVGCNGN